MKIKKGIVWLRRDFENQLKKILAENHVVSLEKLTDFPGRDIVVENMISREDLAWASYDDLQTQKEIERKRKEEVTRKLILKNKLEEEETALKAVMGI
jgi:hypothetical protein